LYIAFFWPVCASVMRGRTVHRETGRKETRGGGKEKRGEKKNGARDIFCSSLICNSLKI
jgi:hypothetical protein